MSSPRIAYNSSGVTATRKKRPSIPFQITISFDSDNSAHGVRTSRCSLCDGNGWRPVLVNGSRRVTRCECVRRAIAAKEATR